MSKTAEAEETRSPGKRAGADAAVAADATAKEAASIGEGAAAEAPIKGGAGPTPRLLAGAPLSADSDSGGRPPLKVEPSSLPTPGAGKADASTAGGGAAGASARSSPVNLQREWPAAIFVLSITGNRREVTWRFLTASDKPSKPIQ